MRAYRLGADPEMFMADALGALKASCGKIGGTKENPQPMGIGDGFFIQEDNVAIEFNIPPASNAKEFVESLRKAITTISDGISNMYGYNIVNLSSASFPDEELKEPAAQVFGCDPDYNAWTGKKNPRPMAKNPNLRTCGGHVHVGIDNPQSIAPWRAVKACDLYLGVPSVLMDKGEERKEMYGCAGAFRPKPYGFEYRTMSNFWVFDDRLINWVWNGVGKALHAVDAQLVDFDSEQEAILTAINNNDKTVAEQLVKKYNLDVAYV